MKKSRPFGSLKESLGNFIVSIVSKRIARAFDLNESYKYLTIQVSHV